MSAQQTSTRGSIVITGSSRGIGAATALKAASIGYSVCVNYLNSKTAADDIVEQIRSLGQRAVAIQADVSLETDVERLFAQATESLGTPVGLVNNVGILAAKKRLEDLSVDRFQRILTTNVLSVFLCTRAAIRRMSIKHGGLGGAIVNVSSAASRLGSAGEYVDYAASKGAMDSLTVGSAKELAADGIRVNAVRPGFIYTDIHASGGEPGRVDRLKALLPMQRGGTPAEVANAIVWLLSEEASFVTGAFIDMAGGI